MHDLRIILSRECVSGPSHVGRELVDLIKLLIHQVANEVRIAQIANDEFVGFTLCKFVGLYVRAPDPEAFPLEPLNKVAPDKAASPADQCLLNH